MGIFNSLSKTIKNKQIFQNQKDDERNAQDPELAAFYTAGKYQNIIDDCIDERTKASEIAGKSRNPELTRLFIAGKYQNIIASEIAGKSGDPELTRLFTAGKYQNVIDEYTKKQQELSAIYRQLKLFPIVSDSISTRLNNINDLVAQGKFNSAETTIQQFLNDIVASLDEKIEALRRNGCICNLQTGNISQLIGEKKYIDAESNAEKVLSELSRINDLFTRSLEIERDAEDPELTTLFAAGKYQNVIDEHSKKQQELSAVYRQLKLFPLVSDSISTRLDNINDLVAQGKFNSAETAIQQFLNDIVASLDEKIEALRRNGCICNLQTGNISQLIGEKKYIDAESNAEKVLSELSRTNDLFARATEIERKSRDPELTSLYTAGNYERVISAFAEKQRISKQVAALQKKTKERLVEANKIVRVPDSIIRQTTAHDLSALESALNAINDFIKTAQPRINLVLSFKQITLDTWEKRTISITNEGSAHAKDVKFKFSDDVDVRRINTIDVLAGETKQFEIPIKSKVKGTIPLDVTVTYDDARDKSYSDTFDFDIEVIEKRTTAPSPVDGFTSKSLTPQDPKIIRAYEFYAGYIRVKISIKNPTPFTIHNVILEPDVDGAILYLERHEPEEYLSENERIILGTINPNNDRTVSLYLEPLICAKEGTDVHCHVRYKDAQGQPGSLDMEPLRIQVVCPIFETKEPVNIGSLKQLIESLPSRDTKIFSVPRTLDAPTQP